MNETKFVNCEQYVLARMFAAEQENDGLKAKVTDQEATIKHLTKCYKTVVELIQRHATVKFASNGIDRYVHMDCPWEKYDDDFALWVEMFGLTVPETNIETNNTEEEN